MSKPEAGKPIVWLRGEVKTPPFSKEARIEAGCLLRLLQCGKTLALPHSRPMPDIGPRCHELRINDVTGTFRIMYRTDPDAIIVLEVFRKKTPLTPRTVIDACARRLRDYDRLTGGQERKR
ncbi:MAG: type II toxin-antitoxin system RelE/ParE family toxin [Nitrospirae bacterium]|nr:MAG: type II toxin-antitoxin system RelE/ParE family toxin [Nitrospirota bacterium]